MTRFANSFTFASRSNFAGDPACESSSASISDVKGITVVMSFVFALLLTIALMGGLSVLALAIRSISIIISVLLVAVILIINRAPCRIQ